MYALTFFLVTILTLDALPQTSIEYTINVGTVLFSPSDLRKSQWSSNEIGLLKARRHFQGLLPPPNFIDTTSEDYVNTLLKYFKETYATIKRQATSPTADSLMTTAFSDAVGGYLKLWVLPISKLAFYGGTVSQENIVKLYQFHKEIKRFLGTDGSGWRSPDKNLLHSITVSVAPPKHIPRSMKNACEQLSYYERTGNGMSIPTPRISWDNHASTMFVPLRNHSLIRLNSPDHQKVLFKYYDAAKSCLDANQNTDSYEFDNRFQNWLGKEVLPHLSDDSVYLPLGSVLSLVNKSREMCEAGINMYEPTMNTHYVYGGIPIDLTSKKFWIITIILLLEVVWCIPALIYLLCARKKKRRGSSTIYTLLEADRHKLNTDYDGDLKDFGVNINFSHHKSKTDGKDKNNTKKGKENVGNDKQKHKGFKIERQPRSENLDVDTQFCPCDSRRCMNDNTYSCLDSNVASSVSVINETKQTPTLKSSLKKIQSSQTSSPTPLVQQPVIINPSKSKKSNYSIQKSERRSSKRIAPEPAKRMESKVVETKTSNQIIEQNKSVNTVQNEPANLEKKQSDSNNHNLDKKQNDVSSQKSHKQSTTNVECPCLTCLEADVSSLCTVVNQEVNTIHKYSDKNVEINTGLLNANVNRVKNVKKTKTVGLRLESGRPYLEITIDKPQTEISVGIGGTFDPIQTMRRSKIPKRMMKTTVAQMSTEERQATKLKTPAVQTTTASQAYKSTLKKNPLTQKNKSQIPQIAKRPVDDIVIKSSATKQQRKENALNITL